ncbi:MAG: hypothetical protein RI926_603 [Actinomycetota bacterium]|jgi:hypothetical protein
MSIMLPSLNSAHLSLADVLPSCLASLGILDVPNKLELPEARAAVVVLVDGLGAHNLQATAAHARFLKNQNSFHHSITSVFPSTTAAALASLTTGVSPGLHGMTGYKVRNPESGEVVNLLTGLGALPQPEQWLTSPPLYSTATVNEVSASVVAHPRFADSSLTKIIHAGSEQVSGKTIEERVVATLSLVQQPGKHLVVLYVSELDELAHNKGVMSSEWSAALESVDGALKILSDELPADAGVFVTADHGVIDVPPTRHYLYGNDVEHMQHIASVGGEPRCLQLYFSEDATASQREATLLTWRKDWSELAWVMSREEVINAGLYGQVANTSMQRIGDIFVLANKDVAFYDERDLTFKGRNMIGQHGGMSTTELSIPAIRLGAFAN